MINRYNDLAANERTYLAWLRTALALVAFGFVLERFELFMHTFANSMGENKIVRVSPLGSEYGMMLVTLGSSIIAMATWRFIKTARLIQSEIMESYSIRSTLALGGAFLLLSFCILFCISRLRLGF